MALTEVVTELLALFHVSLELELSTIVEVFSRFNVGVEAGVGVGVESLSGVDERNIGHVSGGVNSNLVFVVVGIVSTGVEEETSLFSDWATSVSKSGDVISVLLSEELSRDVDNIDVGTLNSRLSAAGELVHSLFVVRLVGRWNSIVLVVVVVVRVTFVVVFLVGVFVGIVQGELGGFGGRSSWVIVDIEVVVLDGLFSPWEESSGEEIVTLSEVVEVSELEALLVTLVLATEGKTGLFFTVDFLELVLVLVGEDVLSVFVFLEGAEVEDVLDCGVRVRSVVEDFLFVLVVHGLHVEFDLGVGDVHIGGDLNWDVNKDVLGKTSNVTFVVEWSDESKFRFQFSGVNNFNFGGYVNSFRDTEEVVVVVGVVTLNSGLNFSTGLDESGDLESVREWQTSGSGESKGERDVVVEFGGVERLSILNLRESIVQTSWDLVEEFFVEEGPALGSENGVLEEGFNFLWVVRLNVELSEDLFGRELLVHFGLLLVFFSIGELFLDLFNEVTGTGGHGSEAGNTLSESTEVTVKGNVNLVGD